MLSAGGRFVFIWFNAANHLGRGTHLLFLMRHWYQKARRV